MTTLILGLNYLPESTSIGPYTADLAEFLRARGHDVRVVSGFPMAPQWKIWAGYRGKLLMRDVVRGVPVLRTWLFIPENPRKAFQRILFDCSFALSAVAGLFFSRPDLVIVISPPLQLGLTALLIGALRRARVFLHIQDLVPDAAIAVGAMRTGSMAVRIAQSLERFIYRRSDGIGVICDGMLRNLVSKGVPVSKVNLVPNYIDLDFMNAQTRENGFRSRFEISSSEFVVMYSGSVAGKQGLETFVEAANKIEPEAGILCCLIGEGPYLNALQEIVIGLSMKKFRFFPLQPREFLPEQLASADVLLITQRKEVKDMVFPGKLLYYMAAGRAVLASVSEDSETGRFVRENGVGLVVNPEDPVALAEAIRWLWTHPERVREYGRNGRCIVETHFERAVVLGKFALLLEGIYPPYNSS